MEIIVDGHCERGRPWKARGEVVCSEIVARDLQLILAQDRVRWKFFVE